MAEGIVVSIHLDFTLDESVAGGGLRPLRRPSEFDEHEFPLPESGEPSP